MPRRAPTADELLDVAISARLGTLAGRVDRGELAEDQAVAELARLAPGRPDVYEAVAERIRNPAQRVGTIGGGPLGDWPPAELQLRMLAAARDAGG